MTMHAEDVARRLLHLRNDAEVETTPLQIIKLVYLAHGWMLGFHGRPLIEDPVEAWKYGPVVPSVYHSYIKWKRSPIDPIPPEAPVKWGRAERHVVEETARAYMDYSPTDLSSITHQKGTPWAMWKSRWIGRSPVISNNDIQDYFRRRAAEGEERPAETRAA